MAEVFRQVSDKQAKIDSYEHSEDESDSDFSVRPLEPGIFAQTGLLPP